MITFPSPRIFCLLYCSTSHRTRRHAEYRETPVERDTCRNDYSVREIVVRNAVEQPRSQSMLSNRFISVLGAWEIYERTVSTMTCKEYDLLKTWSRVYSTTLLETVDK